MEMSNQLGGLRVLGRSAVLAVAAATVITLSLTTGGTAAGSVGMSPEVAVPQEGSTWIDYRVGGDATEEHRESDLVMCAEIGDGEFSLHSMGEWVITVEAPAPTIGEHESTFLVAPPQGKFRDEDARTEDRAKGTGTITLEDGGKGELGMPVLKGTFSAAALSSDSGFNFTLEGSFSCVMF
jgi:hypothetical protein